MLFRCFSAADRWAAALICFGAGFFDLPCFLEADSCGVPGLGLLGTTLGFGVMGNGLAGGWTFFGESMGNAGLTVLLLIILLGIIRPALLSLFRRFFFKSTEVKSIANAFNCVSELGSLDGNVTPLVRSIG